MHAWQDSKLRNWWRLKLSLDLPSGGGPKEVAGWCVRCPCKCDIFLLLLLWFRPFFAFAFTFADLHMSRDSQRVWMT